MKNIKMSIQVIGKCPPLRLSVLYTLTVLLLCSLISIGFILNSIDLRSVNTLFNQTVDMTLQHEHKNRVQHMKNMCKYLQSRVTRAKYKDEHQMHQIYTINWKMAFCVIPKSGCSFQKQLVMYLNKPSMFIQDYNIGYEDKEQILNYLQSVQRDVFNIKRSKVHSLFFNPIKLTMDQFVQGRFRKVMTTRHPYSRLYSAYIDKFYIPVYQSLIRNDVHKIRQNKNPEKYRWNNITPCDTSNISFEEFLEAILLQAQRGEGDFHWLPITLLCEPCLANPDFIIKQESYHDDIQFVLEHMYIEPYQRQTIQSVLGKNGIQSNEILYGLIITMIQRGLQFKGDCFTTYEIAKRVWSALKVQGQVYKYLPFPSKKLSGMKNMTISAIATVFMMEMNKFQITAEESHRQRQRALVQVYKNIRPDILIKIQAMYYYDFMLFDYDLKPPS
ncbi:hypothetical protein ACF0H5_020518 [Mactra antiquata]